MGVLNLFNTNMYQNEGIVWFNWRAEKSVWAFHGKFEHISWRKWMRNLIEYWFRCFFHHPKKRSGPQQQKPSQSPRINKTYYFESFLQRNLGEKGFLFYFSRNILKKLNEKAHLILISFFFHQNFEWESVAHNSRLISRCSFCYTGFTEWYVSLSLGDWEELHCRIEF